MSRTRRATAQLQKGLSEISVLSDVTGNGLEAVALAQQKEYDLIILDLMIPGIDGLEVLRRLRSRGDGTPVIILTARDATKDRIAGLNAGADDYLVKPFSFSELVARIQALLRRGQVDHGYRPICSAAPDAASSWPPTPTCSSSTSRRRWRNFSTTTAMRPVRPGSPWNEAATRRLPPTRHCSAAPSAT